MRIRQAVIFAGGLGTRLLPLTKTVPKPMITVCGKPFLGHLLDLLKENGIRDVVLLVGHLKEKIMSYVGDGRLWNMKAMYSFLPPSWDTGARLKHATRLLRHHFLLLYADNYWPLKLPELTSFYAEKGKPASAVVYANFDGYSRNNMTVHDGIVERYDRKRSAQGLNGVDIGFFILKKGVVDLIPDGNASFEDSVLAALAHKRDLAGFYTYHRYYGLSTIDRIPNIEAYFSPKRVVFLDRDGVINVKPPKSHYVTRLENFQYLPGVKTALQRLSRKRYWLFIITNQPGVARGVMTKRDLATIEAQLLSDLERCRVRIKGVYTCTHGWDEGCFCRKPRPGLLYRAAADHAVELYDSFMVGDDARDILAGKAAGCRTILIRTAGGGSRLYGKPDIIVPSLWAAAAAIEKHQ